MYTMKQASFTIGLSFPLRHPALDLLPALLDQALGPRHGAHRVRLARVPDMPGALPDPEVRIRHDGVPLLERPDELADVAHRVRNHGIPGRDAEEHGHGAAQQQGAVARHDGAGERGHQHVREPGHERLVGRERRRERRDGVGKRRLELQALRHEPVSGRLGARGQPVQLQSRGADLAGEAVRRRR